MKQKLLLTLDNLVEEDQQENEEYQNNLQGAMNTDNEIVLKVMHHLEFLLQEKISEFVMRMIQSPANKILNAIQLSNLNHFVLNTVYENLYSTIDPNSDDFAHSEDQLTILVDSLKPSLDNKTEIFQGKRLSFVQPELLSVIFQELHEIYEDWDA